MKYLNITLALIATWTLAFLTSCDSQLNDNWVQLEVTVLTDNTDLCVDSVEVRLTDANQNVYRSYTNSHGVAQFDVDCGFYSAQVKISQTIGNQYYVANGFLDGISLTEAGITEHVNLQLVSSHVSQLVIKEIYVGGCPKDDGSGPFSNDKYVIVYNNSPEEITVHNFGIACLLPYNANATNNFYNQDGQLNYANQDYLPLGQALWYLPRDVTFAPYSQKVIACNNALDCTQTYSQSVDLSHADLVTYDNTFTTHTKQHPVPDAQISTDNYLKAILISMGTGWALSKVSPAVVIFSTGDVSPESIADNPDNEVFNGTMTQANRCLKLPRQMVLDGIEVFNNKYPGNRKRLTADIDAGYVEHISDIGYSLYRRVDKEATMAIEGNHDLLVMGQDTEQIDAEASMANGAKIVYLDTNNSSDDFYLRKQASLKK